MEITIEHLEFPSVVKEKILKLVNTSKIEVEFINGKNIFLNKTNLALTNPSKVIFSNKNNYIVAIVYETEAIYVQSTKIALTTLINIVNYNL